MTVQLLTYSSVSLKSIYWDEHYYSSRGDQDNCLKGDTCLFFLMLGVFCACVQNIISDDSKRLFRQKLVPQSCEIINLGPGGATQKAISRKQRYLVILFQDPWLSESLQSPSGPRGRRPSLHWRHLPGGPRVPQRAPVPPQAPGGRRLLYLALYKLRRVVTAEAQF